VQLERDALIVDRNGYHAHPMPMAPSSPLIRKSVFLHDLLSRLPILFDVMEQVVQLLPAFLGALQRVLHVPLLFRSKGSGREPLRLWFPVPAANTLEAANVCLDENEIIMMCGYRGIARIRGAIFVISGLPGPAYS
jgi:hypothetical protein